MSDRQKASLRSIENFWYSGLIGNLDSLHLSTNFHLNARHVELDELESFSLRHRVVLHVQDIFLVLELVVYRVEENVDLKCFLD